MSKEKKEEEKKKKDQEKQRQDMMEQFAYDQGEADTATKKNARQYIAKRAIEQIVWFDQKSIEKQKRYKQLTILGIILNAVIPVLVLLSDYGLAIKILVAGLSSAAGALNTIVSFCGYKDLWIRYRSNCELLKSTLHRYFNGVGEFRRTENSTDPTPEEILIEKCEECLTKEFQTWSAVTSENGRTTNPEHHSSNNS